MNSNSVFDTAVRRAIEQGSCHLITSAVILRARGQWGEQWLHAAISQLSQILSLSLVNARALISEHCTEKTKV